MTEDRLLTINEAAKVTGQSKRTIRRWVLEDVMPVERIGPYGRVRIRLSTLQRMYPPDTLRVTS